MHLLSAGCLGAVLFSALLSQVSSLGTIYGLFGETLEIPCKIEGAKAEDIIMTKWKYDKGDGLSGNLLVKQKDQVSVTAGDDYKSRVSLASNFSLLLSEAKLSDQKTFTCMVVAGADIFEHSVNVVIYNSTENIMLQVIAPEPLVEGGNVTLKCEADGNPAPTSFHFHLKGKETVTVENDNTFTITNVSRDTTGEYKCSLIDNPTMEASKDITVNYLDINLSPSGSVEKNAGEALAVNLKVDASGEYTVSWTKDNIKLDKEPNFTKLTYTDAGLYEYEVTMGALIEKTHSSWLFKVLHINGTSPNESSFINGKVTHKITVVPTANLTVSCTVSNDYGTDTKNITVSSHQSEDGDQTKLVVGVVVGVLVAVLVIGLAYWVYMRKSKQGSWKTGEKESGSSEEEKKLEEKVEENSQKAEV
ncbi:hypothetical protein WMY93_017800 [Mugilogobius chulae]|uniref:Ig-like domain-containing protein n=1 Tax=Mugilogobius chulae TaxID=88201 RepID=A0AAW0NS04_9GOBI